jgi:hypothetical protein
MSCQARVGPKVTASGRADIHIPDDGHSRLASLADRPCDYIPAPDRRSDPAREPIHSEGRRAPDRGRPGKTPRSDPGA